MAKERTGVPSESSDITSSPVPLRTRRRRRRRSEPRNKLRRALQSIFLHALIYSLLYTVIWKCPRHPESSRLCPAVNKLTEPFAPFYSSKIAPYAEPAFETMQKSYQAYAQPLLERAASATRSQYDAYGAPYVANLENAIRDQYDDKARAHVEKIMGVASHVYNDNLIPLWEDSQPYITQAQRRANAVAVYSKQVISRQVRPVVHKLAAKGSELAKILWARIVKYYKEVIVVRSLQLYFDHVEPAILRVRDRIFLKAVSEDDAEYDDNNEEDEEGVSKDEEDITSVFTSTITKTVSRTIISSTGSSYPDDTAKETPEITPPVQPIDPEVAEHQLEIERDIISWTAKFRTAGKNAVSKFSIEIESLFSSAQEPLVQTAEANLLRAQGDIESIFVAANSAQFPVIMELLAAKADVVRAQAVEAANSVLRDAESIRTSTLDIFKTVTDIGLQELGRKWAFMEDITWEDWKEYRTLKSMADDFSQIIVEIPIDDNIVRKFLAGFDESIARWMAQVEEKVSKIQEEASLNESTEEGVGESAMAGESAAANEDITPNGDTDLPSLSSSPTISPSLSNVEAVADSSSSSPPSVTSISSTAPLSSVSKSASATSTEIYATSTSVHDEL
ncbi:hypothetical protein V1525DRAFT_361545 [Lipomyces kononenkoae]|uniref:Uncharacterized protein n=1 Tax=Lipomyces kononenkoae TaxID=34357 RepID=A0ACC3SZF8_LIPKO